MEGPVLYYFQYVLFYFLLFSVLYYFIIIFPVNNTCIDGLQKPRPRQDWRHSHKVSEVGAALELRLYRGPNVDELSGREEKLSDEFPGR